MTHFSFFDPSSTMMMSRRLLLYALNRASTFTQTPHRALPLSFCLFSSSKNDDSATERHAAYLQQMQELNEERQALFGFTKEEESAWTNPKIHSSTLMDAVKEARRVEMHYECSDHVIDYRQEEAVECTSFPSQLNLLGQHDDEEDNDEHTLFTHLNKDSQSVNMVDVGGKQVTRRMAKARSKVVFPPEVMAALDISGQDLVGPKGPIFATAKVAGIMAAK